MLRFDVLDLLELCCWWGFMRQKAKKKKSQKAAPWCHLLWDAGCVLQLWGSCEGTLLWVPITYGSYNMQRRMITVSQHRGAVGNVNAALLFRRTSGILMWLHWEFCFFFWFLLFSMIIFINNGRSDCAPACAGKRDSESENYTHSFIPPSLEANRSLPVLLPHLGSDGIYFYLLALFCTHCTLPYLHSVHKFSSEMRVDRSVHSCILVLFLLFVAYNERKCTDNEKETLNRCNRCMCWDDNYCVFAVSPSTAALPSHVLTQNTA